MDPELFGYLEKNTDPIPDLVSGSLLAEFESSWRYDGNAVITTSAGDSEQHVPLNEVRDHLKDTDFLMLRSCHLSGFEEINLKFVIEISSSTFGTSTPLIYTRFQAPGVSESNAKRMIDRMEQFAMTLYEELPIEYFHIDPYGMLSEEGPPERDEFVDRIKSGNDYLSIASGELTKQVGEDILMSLPTYKSIKLADSGVLVRSAETIHGWDEAAIAAVRTHFSS